MRGARRCASWWIAVLAALSVLAAGVDANTTDARSRRRPRVPKEPETESFPVFDLRRTVAPAKAWRPIVQAVERDGHARAILGLRTTFQAEGVLDDSARAAQRTRIADAQAKVLGRLASTRHSVLWEPEHVPFVVLDLGLDAIRALKRSKSASSVRLDAEHGLLLDQSVPVVEANERVLSSGGIGPSTAIAVIDTGVDAGPNGEVVVVGGACIAIPGADPALGGCPNGESFQYGANAAVPCSYFGCDHGTKVANVAASRDSTFTGVARSANVYSLRVVHPTNDCGNDPSPCPSWWEGDVLAAMSLVVADDPMFNFSAVNISLGGEAFDAPCGSEFPDVMMAVQNLASIGVATVAGAGNGGETNAIDFPACVQGVVSVGATDNNDVVWSDSNSAPFLTLLAPGVNINTIAGGGTGTSVAAPHVSGAIDKLRTYMPNELVHQIVNHLKTTGIPVTDPKNGVTTRRIRTLNAQVNAPDGQTKLRRADIAGEYEIPGGGLATAGVGLLKNPFGADTDNGTIMLTGVPQGAKIVRAFLYWMVVGTADSEVGFSQQATTIGTLVGASPGCDGYTFDGATRVYRADVTPFVSGNGNYFVYDVGETPGEGVGASLAVVYEPPGPVAGVPGGKPPLNRIIFYHGSDTTTAPIAALNSVKVKVPSPITSAKVHVGVGFGDPNTPELGLIFAGQHVGPNGTFNGSSGTAWDDRNFQLNPNALPNTTSDVFASLIGAAECLGWAYLALHTTH